MIAEDFAIKNPKGIIKEVQEASKSWEKITMDLQIPERVKKEIAKSFMQFK